MHLRCDGFVLKAGDMHTIRRGQTRSDKVRQGQTSELRGLRANICRQYFHDVKNQKNLKSHDRSRARATMSSRCMQTCSRLTRLFTHLATVSLFKWRLWLFMSTVNSWTLGNYSFGLFRDLTRIRGIYIYD